MRTDNDLLREAERRYEEHYTVAQIMAGVIALGLFAWAVMVGSQVIFLKPGTICLRGKSCVGA